MLIYYCQIQFVLQNNSGFHRLRLADKFSNSQEQRRIEVLQSSTQKHGTIRSMVQANVLLNAVKISVDKRSKLFVAIWFSNFAQNDLAIVLFVVFSLIDGSIFFFLFFLIFLLTICRCKRFCEMKDMHRIQSLNFKFESFFLLYLWICESSKE